MALAEALSDFVKLERALERIKIELAVKDDFNLIEGFGMFDTSGKGYITAAELRSILQ